MGEYKAISPQFLEAIRGETPLLVLHTVNIMQQAWETVTVRATQPTPSTVLFSGSLISAALAHRESSRALSGAQYPNYRLAVDVVAGQRRAYSPQLNTTMDAAVLCRGAHPTAAQLQLLHKSFPRQTDIVRNDTARMFSIAAPGSPALALRHTENAWVVFLAWLQSNRLLASSLNVTATLAAAGACLPSNSERAFCAKVGCTYLETNYVAETLNTIYRKDIARSLTFSTQPASILLPTFVDSRGRTYVFHSRAPSATMDGRTIYEMIVTHEPYEAKHRRPGAPGWYKGSYQHYNDMNQAAYRTAANTRANLPFVTPLNAVIETISGWACEPPQPTTTTTAPPIELTPIILPRVNRVVTGIMLWPNQYAWSYPPMVFVPINSRQITKVTAGTPPRDLRYLYECYCLAYAL